MNKTILEIEHTVKTFAGGRRAVDDVSLSITEGETFGFLGPNGAGKTTMIRLILNLLHPDSGRIRICGIDVSGGNRRDALRLTGALVEGPAFYPYLTGMENLRVFARYAGGIEKRRIRELLELVGLAGREKERVSGYSLGMKQRLGIAQALLADPKLLILDEPTNGLDPHGVRDIRTLVRFLSGEKKTSVFISSHLLSEIQQMCDTVAVIAGGRIAAAGRVSELLSTGRSVYEIKSPDTDRIAAFCGTSPGCRVISREPLRVEPAGDPSGFLGLLVREGFRIDSFGPVQPTLEDFFFSTTGTGGSGQ